MRFITCASYYVSGSSAITDLVSEFEPVYSFTTEEFRFIQDPDGVSDLEFHLVECFNRHNSGHALKRYKKLVDFYSGNKIFKRYSHFFGDQWKTLSYQYIDRLTDFTFSGWWMYDLYDRGSWFFFRKRILNWLLHKTLWKRQPERTLNTMKHEITYCAHPSEEKFLAATRQYILALFSCVMPEGKEIMMVDQLLPPTNMQRYLRYFDNNMQAVIVDRDPRDIFVLEKYMWKDGVIPTDVDTFCQWFEYTRAHRKTEDVHTQQVHFVQFEDLVYHYEETTRKLCSWLGLSQADHTRPRTAFCPEMSIQNTQTWKKYAQSLPEVKVIEERLSEYLYPFPQGE